MCPVDGRGYLTKEAGEFAGLFYEDANRVIINRLNEENALLKEIEIIHSYPHDWRTKNQLFFELHPNGSLQFIILKKIF